MSKSLSWEHSPMNRLYLLGVLCYSLARATVVDGWLASFLKEWRWCQMKHEEFLIAVLKLLFAAGTFLMALLTFIFMFS